jgi:hypothetical protein
LFLGARRFGGRFVKFMLELPAICANLELGPDALTFVEFVDIASTWLKQESGAAA